MPARCARTKMQHCPSSQSRVQWYAGNAEVSTSRLVTADAQTLSLPLRGGCVDAACSVRLTEATEYQTRVFMAIQLVGDPQPETTLVLSLMDPQQEWIELHRAQVHPAIRPSCYCCPCQHAITLICLPPASQAARDRWPPFELTFSQLRGDLELPLRLQVFRAGGRLAGQAVLRAQALRDASVGGQSLQLSQPGGRGVQLKVLLASILQPCICRQDIKRLVVIVHITKRAYHQTPDYQPLFHIDTGTQHLE